MFEPFMQTTTIPVEMYATNWYWPSPLTDGSYNGDTRCLSVDSTLADLTKPYIEVDHQKSYMKVVYDSDSPLSSPTSPSFLGSTFYDEQAQTSDKESIQPVTICDNQSNAVNPYHSYTKVAVLMLSWKNTNQDASYEINCLRDVFRSYSFHIVDYIFQPDKDIQKQLNRALAEFTFEHEDRNTLLIVYYNGHGKGFTQANGQPGYIIAERCCQSPEQVNSTNAALWTDSETLLNGPSDGFLIFDSCSAGSLLQSHNAVDKGIRFEYLTSCAATKTCPVPGDPSFTRSLTRALRYLESREIFSTNELYDVTARIYRSDQVSATPLIGDPRIDSVREPILIYPMDRNLDESIPRKRESQKRESQKQESQKRESQKNYVDVRINLRHEVTGDGIAELSKSLQNWAHKNYDLSIKNIRFLSKNPTASVLDAAQIVFEECIELVQNKILATQSEQPVFSSRILSPGSPGSPRMKSADSKQQLRVLDKPIKRFLPPENTESFEINTPKTTTSPSSSLQCHNGFVPTHKPSLDAYESERERNYDNEEHLDEEQELEDENPSIEYSEMKVFESDIEESLSFGFGCDSHSGSCSNSLYEDDYIGYFDSLVAQRDTSHEHGSNVDEKIKSWVEEIQLNQCAGNETLEASGDPQPEHQSPKRNNTSKTQPKNKKRLLEEESQRSDADDNFPKKRKPKQPPDDDERLVCPFFRRDPLKHRNHACRGIGFTSIQRLLEHLRRVHRRPRQCPRCWEALPDRNDGTFAAHLNKIPKCNTASPRYIEGIAEEHSQEFKKRKKKRGSIEDTESKKMADYRLLWEILFPSEEFPGETRPVPTPQSYPYLSYYSTSTHELSSQGKFASVPTITPKQDYISTEMGEPLNQPSLLKEIIKKFSGAMFQRSGRLLEIKKGLEFLQSMEVPIQQLELDLKSMLSQHYIPIHAQLATPSSSISVENQHLNKSHTSAGAMVIAPFSNEISSLNGEADQSNGIFEDFGLDPAIFPKF